MKAPPNVSVIGPSPIDVEFRRIDNFFNTLVFEKVFESCIDSARIALCKSQNVFGTEGGVHVADTFEFGSLCTPLNRGGVVTIHPVKVCSHVAIVYVARVLA